MKQTENITKRYMYQNPWIKVREDNYLLFSLKKVKTSATIMI